MCEGDVKDAPFGVHVVRIVESLDGPVNLVLRNDTFNLRQRRCGPARDERDERGSASTVLRVKASGRPSTTEEAAGQLRPLAFANKSLLATSHTVSAILGSPHKFDRHLVTGPGPHFRSAKSRPVNAALKADSTWEKSGSTEESVDSLQPLRLDTRRIATMEPTVSDRMHSVRAPSIAAMYGAQRATPSWFRMDDHMDTSSGAVYPSGSSAYPHRKHSSNPEVCSKIMRLATRFDLSSTVTSFWRRPVSRKV
mmetsp:Transcript_821/g.2730  ORF Transcript_821/g.2730 Transcript_821/m.2730 type:complete len:252 (-) Transcript_821:336-1091(-)